MVDDKSAQRTHKLFFVISCVFVFGNVSVVLVLFRYFGWYWYILQIDKQIGPLGDWVLLLMITREAPPRNDQSPKSALCVPENVSNFASYLSSAPNLHEDAI
jgi:hypothetical protein